MHKARNRAHLWAMLRPASKKHTRTMSERHFRVFESRLSFPSLELQNNSRHLDSSWTSTHISKWPSSVISKVLIINLPGPFECTPANQQRVSNTRLWACSVIWPSSAFLQRVLRSFSWNSENCNIAHRCTLKNRRYKHINNQNRTVKTKPTTTSLVIWNRECHN